MLPNRLCLRTGRDQLVEVIALLEYTVLIRRQPVLLYFDQVSYLEPAAALLLVAAIYRCRSLVPMRGRKSVTGTYPKNTDIARQLAEIGFFKQLGVQSPKLPEQQDADRPLFVHFQSDSRIYGEVAANFCDLVTMGAFTMSPVTKGRMVAALKEAMGNAHEHAYRGSTGLPVMKQRWWVAGYLDPVAQEMMIMILDQGVGISQTLDPTALEFLKAFVRLSPRPTDGELIAAATELHRTSTAERGRGRGFRDMKRFVDSCDDGELRVLSLGGAYSYTKTGHDIADFAQPIGGTLVEWRVRHSSVADVGDE